MLNFKIVFLLMTTLFVTALNCSLNKQSKVDELFKAYSGNDVPGAAVAVIRHDSLILAKGYGMANLEEHIPVQPNTNFRLASVTKQFTALCIMMLVERGKLSFDRTLKQIFPEFPDYGKQITIRDILHHTSGLVAYEDLIPDTATVQVLDKDVLEMMMAQDSTYFPPGSDYRYSNTGYAVLAMVIEKISGKSFAKFLKENIFDPLGMTETVAYEKNISTVNHRAYGYTLKNGEFVFTDQSITSAVLGDGGIYSSISDMYKWNQALYTQKLVSAEMLKLAFTPGAKTNGDSLDYGFGWRIDKYHGLHRVHHTGSTMGFRNVIQRFPDEHSAVIILTNRNDPGVADLANQLVDLYLLP